jgi:tRNA U34 5-carboxymethylaminomethyl modifying GTPase MnmE/TrmE
MGGCCTTDHAINDPIEIKLDHVKLGNTLSWVNGAYKDSISQKPTVAKFSDSKSGMPFKIVVIGSDNAGKTALIN